MAKVVLIGLYDNWALGLRLLSNALISKGNEVAIVNFKLTAGKELNDFLKYPLHYENVHSNQSSSRMILKGYGIDVNMWTHNELGLLEDLLKELGPDIIGLSTRSIYEDYHYIDQLMDLIKRVPGTVTVAGGFGATFNPERYLDVLDYVCVGEGESAIVKMAECVNRGRIEAVRKINNLVYKEKGRAVYNLLEPPSDPEDYWFNVDMGKVQRFVIEDNRLQKGTPFIKNILDQDPDYDGCYYTMAGRGCLWDCSFCSAGRFYKKYDDHAVFVKKRRMRPISDIMTELKYIKEKCGFKKIFFMDSYFSAQQDYLMEFFGSYKREINMPFFAQFYPPQILSHPEILAAAHEAGLSHTVVGLQSGSDDIANEVMNRKEPIGKIIEFARLIAQYDNIQMDYHLITHNPFEKEQHIEENFNVLSRLPKKNSQLILQRLRPFRTSVIAEKIEKANLDPMKNMAQDKINFILYLIRFYAPDDVFNRVRKELNSYSADDLKEIYAQLRKEYDARYTLSSRGYSSNPILLQEHKGFNLVIYQRQIWAFAQNIGSLDLTRTDTIDLERYRAEKRFFSGDSIEQIKALIDALEPCVKK